MAGYEWKLTELNGSPVIGGRDITLKLEEQQAGGSAGCNSYGGQVTLDGVKISFTRSLLNGNGLYGPGGIMEQESAYLQALSQAASYHAAGVRLELKNAAGETILIFSRTLRAKKQSSGVSGSRRVELGSERALIRTQDWIG